MGEMPDFAPLAYAVLSRPPGVIDQDAGESRMRRSIDMSKERHWGSLSVPLVRFQALEQIAITKNRGRRRSRRYRRVESEARP